MIDRAGPAGGAEAAAEPAGIRPFCRASRRSIRAPARNGLRLVNGHCFENQERIDAETDRLLFRFSEAPTAIWPASCWPAWSFEVAVRTSEESW
jgi:hypothetical protein